MLELHSNSAENTIKIGEKIGLSLKKGDIIAYKGTLAAGKTTLTKGIAKALQVDEVITMIKELRDTYVQADRIARTSGAGA